MADMPHITQALQGYEHAKAARQPRFDTEGPLTVEKAREVAQKFEAHFLGQMLQPMFQNIKAEEPFGGGPAADMWKSLQVDEYGKAMTKAGGIGIADMVMKQILQMQEGR